MQVGYFRLHQNIYVKLIQCNFIPCIFSILLLMPRSQAPHMCLCACQEDLYAAGIRMRVLHY